MRNNQKGIVLGVLILAALFCSQCGPGQLPEKKTITPLSIESPSIDTHPPEIPSRSLNDVEVKFVCPDDLQLQKALLVPGVQSHTAYLECGDSKSALFSEDSLQRDEAFEALKFQLNENVVSAGEGWGIYRVGNLPKTFDGKNVGGVTMFWGDGITSTLRMNKPQFSPRLKG